MWAHFIKVNLYSFITIQLRRDQLFITFVHHFTYRDHLLIAAITILINIDDCFPSYILFKIIHLT